MNDSINNRVVTTEHFSSTGEKFTREVHPFGNAGCYEIIKNSAGRVIRTNGSGGWRPWGK